MMARATGPGRAARLDRADHLRADAGALSALTGDGAMLLLLDGLAARLDGDGRLGWGMLDDAPADAELVLLGLIDGRGCFAAVPRGQGDAGGDEGRRVFGLLSATDPDEAALYAMARSLVDWHARHRFCARCGGQTAPGRGGWQRDCTDPGCHAVHYPRVDPVTIMTVENRRGELLLGRQPRFPARFYSALAGFVEPGETVEEAVAREVREEAGIDVRDVEYVASQAWPFPSQLMIGCHCFADDDRLVVDRHELEDARWFTRAEVAAAIAEASDAAFSPPPLFAVAHQLIRAWLARG